VADAAECLWGEEEPKAVEPGWHLVRMAVQDARDQSLLTGDDDPASCAARASFTLYRGATVDDPVEGMFSFVPARHADGHGCRFARPPVRLTGFVNPTSTQSTWGSKRPLTMGTLHGLWEQVCHQIEAEGLLLAVRLETPDRSDDGPVAETDLRRC
jgi:hypothetical protein